ncbi:MAG: hypothetical protein ACRD88_15150 [Terriglobia bacterium]
MSKRNWEQEMISGLAAIAFLGIMALPAIAQKGPNGKTVPVQAHLEAACASQSCSTDVGGWDQQIGWLTPFPTPTYSLLPDPIHGADYVSGFGVQSEILTHNTVFTLDTLDTLSSTGTVTGSTITVNMHFYNGAGLLPPSCWGPHSTNPDGSTSITVNQAVNWSIFSNNSISLTDMQVGPTYGGFSRLDFNVRNGDCDNNIFRYYLRWSQNGGGITIQRRSETEWEITTNSFGTAGLFGQGGRRRETVYYGDWRVPFKVILTKQ